MTLVPEAFARRLTELEPAGGPDWLARLPELVAAACRRWNLTITGPARHGLVALVLPVLGGDGTPAVLKISWPHPEARHEGAALAAWAGRGTVRLLAWHTDSWALLLERLDAERTLEDRVGDDAATATLGQLVARVAGAAGAAATAPAGMATLAALAERWAEELPAEWAALGGPVSRRALDAAVATCRELVAADPTALLHGDLHYANVLACEREPWLAIDPKPLLGDPAWEAASALWNRWPELAARGVDRGARRRLAVWCEASGVDAEPARRWAQARAVDAVLWLSSTGAAVDESQRVLAEALC